MVSVETLRLLADIGFMATSGGLSPQAAELFRAIELARPDSVLPHIGKALNCMNMKKHQDALDVLEKKALPMEPDNDSIKALIGMALMMMGRNNESERCLQAIASSEDKDPMAVEMATALLAKHNKNSGSSAPGV
ncbi:MAG: tetratricopeptide repeat protein [Kistimonas sp.]|nr:tetratricopeptide repeat protein [Kistimonas sp.]